MRAMQPPHHVSVMVALLFLVAGACGNRTSPETIAPADPAPAATAAVETEAVEQLSIDPEPEQLGIGYEVPTREASEPEPSDPWPVLVATANDDVEWVDTRDEPDGGPADIEWGVWNPTPFGTTLAMVVVDGTADDEWVEVMVPVKPNGSTAWVRADQFSFSEHRYHAEVDLGTRQVTVWEGDVLVVQTDAVIGAPGTPTPVGRFYVNDLVTGDGAAYGPWILSLSAFSEALDSFNGGEPVIAIHGTNQPELLGQSRSNGCIRVPNDIVSFLAETVPLGTPVDILS